MNSGLNNAYIAPFSRGAQMLHTHNYALADYNYKHLSHFKAKQKFAKRVPNPYCEPGSQK